MSIKWIYAKKVSDFSDKSIRIVFDTLIDKIVAMRADGWKNCNPLAKDYRVDQVLSRKKSLIQIFVHDTPTNHISYKN